MRLFTDLDLSESVVKRSVLAEVNGEVWDMHRPLPSDCTLKLLNMKPDNQQHANLVNKTFWRSCSFILGNVIEDSFNDDVAVTLHSFPPANGNQYEKINSQPFSTSKQPFSILSLMKFEVAALCMMSTSI